MRVAIISNGYFWLPTEPGPSRVFEIAKAFAKAGHDTEVITTDFQHFQKKYRDTEAAAAAGYPFRLTFIPTPAYKKNIDPLRLRSNAVVAQRILKYLKPVYDAVYCTIPSNRVAARVSEWCRMNGVPFVVDIEDLWPEAMAMVVPQNALTRAMLSPLRRDAETAYRNASAVIGTSDDYTMRAFQNREKNIPYRTVFVGCDLAAFDAGAKQYLPEVEKSEDEYWVTYAGSIGTSYDIRTLVDAGKMLRDIPAVFENAEQGAENAVPEEWENRVEKPVCAGKRVKIKIMGTGPMKEELEAYAAQSGADNVEFMGYTAYPKMAAVLCRSDIAVNSFVKGAPQSIVNKVGDYLAAGIPMLSTLENPVFTSLVDEYGFGVNVPAEDAEALKNAILDILRDREGWQKMAGNARKLAEERFDRAAAYPEIVKITEECS